MKIDLNLNEGQSGEWTLSKFIVSEDDAQMFNLRCIISGQGDRSIEAGTYWRLRRGKVTVMSNTPAEVQDHYNFIANAEGEVLIAGLGLGMVLTALLKKDNVKHVTVVEKSTDVINLVSKSYQDPRVEIVNADIFEFKPDRHYDWAWFDIWDNITGEEYEEMKKLIRKFSRSASHKDCWMRKDSQKLYLEEKHYQEDMKRLRPIICCDNIDIKEFKI